MADGRSGVEVLEGVEGPLPRQGDDSMGSREARSRQCESYREAAQLSRGLMGSACMTCLIYRHRGGDSNLGVRVLLCRRPPQPSGETNK